MLKQFWSDLRMALRRLRARPGFSLIVISVLGLGLATTIFGASTLDSFVLRPLPFPKAERLLWLNSRDAGDQRRELDLRDPEIRQLQQRPGLLAAVETLASWYNGTANLNAGGISERLSGAFVEGPLFDLLGTRAVLGRTLEARDGQPGAAPVVVLGHAIWRDRFAADPGVLGRTTRINGRSVEVIGVMPAGFAFPFQEQLWLNAPLTEDADTNRTVIARLKPGAVAAQVATELDAVLNQSASEYRETPRKAYVSSLANGLVDETTRSIVIILFVSGLLTLLIASSNAATLLLARANQRRGELALRAALGAGRSALLREVLCEALLLALAAMVLALLLSTAAGYAMFRQLQEVDDGMPYYLSFGIDLRLFLIALVAALLCAGLAGLVPAMRSAGGRQLDALRGLGRGGLQPGSHRLLASLVIMEVALCLVLLTGGAVMKRYLDDLVGRPLGANVDQVMTARIALFEHQYADAAQRDAYQTRLRQQLQLDPAFSEVALSTGLPGFRSDWTHVRRDLDELEAPGGVPVYAVSADPEYFQLYQIGIEQGRGISPADTADSTAVVVIDRRLAAMWFPAGDAIGRKIRIDRDGQGVWRTIVGISAPVQQDDLDDQWRPAIFTPFSQNDEAFFQVSVRGRDPGADLATTLKAAITRIDPDTPGFFVRPMTELVAMGNFGPSFLARIFSVMAALGLLLAATGIYGVLAYAVEQRTREFGLKRALGAGGYAVMRTALQSSAGQLVFGLLLGVMPAIWFAQLLAGVIASPGTDGQAVVLSILVLALAALVAAGIPARRALKVDPLTALRAE